MDWTGRGTDSKREMEKESSFCTMRKERGCVYVCVSKRGGSECISKRKGVSKSKCVREGSVCVREVNECVCVCEREGG